MPDFYVDDVNIDPSEFVGACSKKELKELIQILVDYGHIEAPNLPKKLGVFEEHLSQKLDLLKDVVYRMSDDDIGSIEQMVSKYC